MAAQQQQQQFEIDSAAFFDRLKKVYDAWKANKNEESWGGADALIISAGDASDEVMYKKSSAVQIWFFNYEFPETIIVLTANSIKVLTSPKKVQIFKGSIADTSLGPAPVEFIAKGTDQTKEFKYLIEGIQKSYGGKTYGTFTKEKPKGKWIEAWLKELETAGLKPVDINDGFADILAVKDEKEQKNVRTAATISAYVLKSKLLPLIETVIDEEKKVTHKSLAEEAEKVFEDPSVISKKLQKDQLDTCYTPIIQSGGNYDLKFSAVNDDNNLSFDTIVCSLGAKFKSYCTAVARTYLVDPTPYQTEVYQILVDVQQLLINSLKPGVKLSNLYNRAIEMVSSSKKDLVDKFTKNCGFVMGLEFRDAAYEINAKNSRTVKAGMVFNLAVGFHNTTLPGSQKQFSVFLADTILVKEDSVEILTDKAPKGTTDVTYYLETEDPNAAQAKKEEKPKPKPAPKVPAVSTAVIESKFRESTVQRKEEKSKLLEAEAKRREHQKELEQRAKEDAAERFLKGKKKDSGPTRSKDVESYKDAAQFPKELVKNKIFIDNSRESIFLPIYGVLVPFHISTVKNASKTDEEFLRINFVTPDAAGTTANKSEIVQSPKSIRIKEMTYRFSDSKDLNNSLRLIKELRKRFNERELEGKTRASIVEQEKLVLSKARNPRLTDLFVRPNPVGRRTSGSLEAHTNGFRFTPMKGDSIDILYKNIKHAFFQPAEKELIVLIHFHLHNAIMVGKKKTFDIQFCTEVMEVSQSLDGRRYDQDELEDENRERQMRTRLNNEFQTFVRKVEDLSVDFDIPYRDLGFFGVPHRSSVLLQPTVHCMVNLTETPFFVLTLSDIEIAYFERVQFNVKNFDLVFVFKDYERAPAHINSISTESLDTIREWLDQCDIKYYEGTQNLNWTRIMQAINEDPVKFHTEDGGWAFLNSESSDEEGSDNEEAEDDFNPSDSEGSASESEEEEDEDEFEEEEEDDEDEPLSEDEEEEGEDWDALEEKARNQDMKEKEKKRARGESDDSEDEDSRRPKKSGKKAPPRKH